MIELIKITKNNKGTNIVSARELYSYLEATERFQSWFERQMQYGFVENVDFAGCEVFNALANQNVMDYVLTLDTAKEISMIQRSEKGKLARQYFIACEKQLLNPRPRTHLEVIDSERALLIANEKANALLLEANTKIEADKPKVIFADSVIGSSGSVLIRQFAKDMCTDHFKIGQKKTIEFLKKNKYVNDKLEPYQNYVNMGLFEVITRVISSSNITQPKKTTKITGKGQVYFAEKIKTQSNE